MLMNATPTALRIVVADRERSSRYGGLPWSSERRPANSAASVVVLIPPAHEPGQAPMNMATHVSIKVAALIAPTSTTLKPAVRHEADWNNAAAKRSVQCSGANEAVHSSSRYATVTPPSRSPVARSDTRV